MLSGGLIALMLTLIFLGMPIAFALGVCGALGLYLLTDFSGLIAQVSSTAYRVVASDDLAAIPLFVLMAELMSQGGMARRVFSAANKFVGEFRGGVGIAAVLASAGFAAVSGSSTASAGTLAAISLPEFKRLRYGLSAATGIVSVAGTLAIMIPPSIAFIIYGHMTSTSIGKLLIAGIIPGVLTATLYVIGISVWARLSPTVLPAGERTTWAEKFESLRGVIGFLLIVIATIVCLYAGITTTNETAAAAATMTLLYLVWTRQIGLRGIVEALRRSVHITVMVFTIIVGALIFGYFLAVTRSAPELIEAIERSGVAPWQILSLVLLLYLVLGCVMEQAAILLITLPLTFPLVMSQGYDPIWFGVIVVKLVEIGLVTPPIGMNAFVVSAATGVPIPTVFRGTGYMLLFEFITFVLLLAFPILSTWLPSMMTY